MKVLVINAGSSSLKSTLFDYSKKNPTQLSKSFIENIGKKGKVKNHQIAFKNILNDLISSKIIKSLKDIDAVGHRVVHGGEKYHQAVTVNAKVLKDIKKLSTLAPLHNPVNLRTLKAAKKALSKAKHVVVFDTAFHQSIPEKAYLYGLPYKLYKKEAIRRYGFHGSSHKYVINQTIKLSKKKKSKIISCHIGNGISITASNNGISQDTSMGFTPLEGVLMGTRSGSIDPAILIHLQKNLKLTAKNLDELLNKESGLLGISGISSDMRDIYAKYKKKDPAAIRTMETLAYQIAKYIGAYSASLNGLDSLVFTATMGEKAFYLREKICEYLSYLGITLDKKKNKAYKGGEELISNSKAKVKVYVVPTNEELQIATETKKLLC
jgi:acetate kinase